MTGTRTRLAVCPSVRLLPAGVIGEKLEKSTPIRNLKTGKNATELRAAVYLRDRPRNNYWLDRAARLTVTGDLPMNVNLPIMVLAVFFGSVLDAAVLPPDQLLPADTLATIAVPDCADACSEWKAGAMVKLWSDPAMQPFRANFTNQWQHEVLDRLEQEWGVRPADYAPLLQGQLTLALVANGWPATPGKRPGWLVALDVRDHEEELTNQLSAWRAKLTESGRTLRTEKIRDAEFTGISISEGELRNALSAGGKSNTGAVRPIEIWFGQSDTVLWLGDQRDVLEQALARQAGNGEAALKSNPDFSTAYEAGMGSAQAYGWVHVKPLVDYVLSRESSADGSADGAMGMLQPSKILPALGLQGLRSISFNLSSAAAGMTAEVRVGIPASARTGLFKMILPDRKDAGPPNFVPADTCRFQRVRVDLREAWQALEDTVYAILPTARGVVDLMFQSVGKDQDPNYDLRKELIGNLGDDVMVIEQPPTTNSLAGLSEAPSLYLIGSPAPAKVAGALKTLAGLLPPPMNNLRQRDVDGHTVYSLALPEGSEATPGAPKRWLSFGAAADYLALSVNAGVLESYLRTESPGDKPLAAIDGLKAAAAKVGGTGNGWFGYENDRIMAKAILEALKENSSTLDHILSATPAGAALAKSGGLKAWADFSLLPPFEPIAGYFHFSVTGLEQRAEDFSYRMFSPTPPGLRP